MLSDRIPDLCESPSCRPERTIDKKAQGFDFSHFYKLLHSFFIGIPNFFPASNFLSVSDFEPRIILKYHLCDFA